jgi:integrase
MGITTPSIREWVSSLELGGIGATTIRQSYRLLHQILESALVDERITRNPAVGIRLPKTTKKKIEALTVEQVLALARECGKYGLLIKFLAMTGVRINEALSLRVGDIAIDSASVHISKTWTSTSSGKKVLGATKTREVRSIPLGPELVSELQDYITGKSENDWLFTGAAGDALDYGYFRRAIFEPATKKLGLTGVTIHTLRHTCASLLISLQTPITTVSQILGHASIKMTLDTYSHYYKDDAEAWMGQLDDVFAKGVD